MAALTYVIVETDCQPMDGEFIDHDKAMNWSIYASPGSRILAFDLAQPSVIPMHDVTKEIVEEAYQAGIYDCDDAAIERARDNLPGQYIDFPPTEDEEVWNRADFEYDRRRDERAMGWAR